MRLFLNSLILLLALLAGCSDNDNAAHHIRIDGSQKLYSLQGGLGASWHAISKEIPLNLESYKYLPQGSTPRGSAYGGNPPVTDKKGWKQVTNHAAWLGLNFIRVEMSQRMYEPERRQFDWDNDEMQVLYNILDWCQQNEADVLLQQMWRYVEWNAIPEVHPLVSAPKNAADFVYSIATLMEYLVNAKGYSCIRYFGMSNEPPGGTWGSWWEYGQQEGSINDVWKMLHEEFTKRGIKVCISGPGWTDMPPFEEEKFSFSTYMGSFDIHSYHGVTTAGEENLRKWAAWAHQQNKPFFLTEFGNMNLGWRGDNPAPKSFDAALSNAQDVIRGLHAGVDGFNRWSFTNRGDLDGQWQLIHTWDRDKKKYLTDIVPEKEAYYGFAILSRFFSKYASTIACIPETPDSLLMQAAVLSPEGELSVFLVNLKDVPVDVLVETLNFPNKTMCMYQVSEEILSRPDYEMNAVERFNSGKKRKLSLPSRSITTVTSYDLRKNDNGIIIK